MYLFRFGQPHHEKPGILLHEKMYDVSSFGEDYGEAFLETGGLQRLAQWLRTQPTLPLVPEGARIGPCVMRPSKMLCVGLNYTKHAFESKMPLPPRTHFLF